MIDFHHYFKQISNGRGVSVNMIHILDERMKMIKDDNLEGVYEIKPLNYLGYLCFLFTPLYLEFSMCKY